MNDVFVLREIFYGNRWCTFGESLWFPKKRDIKYLRNVERRCTKCTNNTIETRTIWNIPGSYIVYANWPSISTSNEAFLTNGKAEYDQSESAKMIDSRGRRGGSTNDVRNFKETEQSFYRVAFIVDSETNFLQISRKHESCNTSIAW